MSGAPSGERVYVYLDDENVTLKTTNLTLIEGCLRHLRRIIELRQDAPASAQQQRVVIACEEFQETLQILWPGATHQAKGCQAAAIEAIFQTRSWSAVEAKSAEALECGTILLRACEAAAFQGLHEVPTTRAEVLTWIAEIQTEQHHAAARIAMPAEVGPSLHELNERLMSER